MDTMRKARIAYTGPALAEGDMDIRELAPALLAFGNLVEAIHHAVGIEQEVRISINADSIKRGSFDLTMFLHPQTVLEQAKILVGAADESGLSALMQILEWGGSAIGIGTGIFSFMKWLRGRTPDSIETGNDGKTTVTFPNGDRFITSADVLKVYKDAKCREHIETITRPVGQDGIDGFEIRNPDEPDDKKPITQITKADLPLFLAPHVENTELETREQEMFAFLVSPNFSNGKWRFNNGDHNFYADVLDEKFLQKVENGDISFRKGDILRIRFYIHQTVRAGKLSNAYIITKVLELQHPPDQMSLF